MIDNRIKPLVDSLVQSYGEYGEIIKIDTENQLNRSVIIEILEKLRCLLFPGYFGKKNITSTSVEYYAGDLLEAAIYNLSRQIAYALWHREDFNAIGRVVSNEVCALCGNSSHKPNTVCIGEGIFKTANDLTFAFLEKLPKIREYLDADVSAAFEGDPAASSKDEIISSYPGLYAILVNRLAHELHLLDVPLIPRIMTEHAHSLTGIDIHPGASIGHHFFIDHGTGVVIGETTVIGNYVKLYQGVTLGALSTRGGQSLKSVKRHPTIEDNVTIYSGASILGGETIIGEGVIVGSNAFITKSVPKKTKVSIKIPELQYKKDGQPEEIVPCWFYTI